MTTQIKNQPRVAVIIPTYNEPELLEKSLQSLLDQHYSNLVIYIINSGDPLNITHEECIVCNVPKNYFWGHAMGYGFKKVLEDTSLPQYILLFNADVKILNNSLSLLVSFLEQNKDKKVIASCPVYNEKNDQYHLFCGYMYSKKLLAHRPVALPWKLIEEAPSEPIIAPLVGGQGVLIPTELAALCPIDATNFPHYAGDIDLWYSSRKKEYKIFMLPYTATVEMRTTGGNKYNNKFTFKNMFDCYNPYSIILQWRLSKKHLPLPLALCSILMFSFIRLIPIHKILKIK